MNFKNKICIPAGKKQIYSTEQDAINMAALISAERGQKIEAYKCPHCKLYHIGHKNYEQKCSK